MRAFSGMPIARCRSRRGSSGSRRFASTRSSAATSRRRSASRRCRAGLRPTPFASPALADAAATAGRLAKADLATDMVRELTELQGVMGGIYAREEGQPERGVEGDLLPLPAGSRRRRCAADPRAARRGGRHVGGGIAGRQARYGRRDVLRRREADRLARSVRVAPRRRTGIVQDARRSAGVDRARRRVRRSTRCSQRRPSVCGARRLAGREPPGDGRLPARALSVRARAARLRRPQRARGAAGERIRAAEPCRCAEAQARGAAGVHGLADFQQLAVRSSA